MAGDEQATRPRLGQPSYEPEAYGYLHKRALAEDLEGCMRFEAALTGEAHSTSIGHLLQHYGPDTLQEDLCFALWRPSSGRGRLTALVDEVILPENGERLLHGNASFQPSYLARALSLALRKRAGLAFMHSHPGLGWQRMSEADIEAERDILAYPAGATGLPLVGLTVGVDGQWSARFWEREGTQMRRRWCEKTRVVGSGRYELHFNDELVPAAPRREVLRRTFDTWGPAAQNTISRLHVGIVGLGSVGCLVAEAIARMGVARVTLIDPDRIEEHNLDRLLYGTVRDIGQLKVDVAAEAMRRNATANNIEITALPLSVHQISAYDQALDCDIIFSCVDRPVARDVLNLISQAHMIPVVDGGVSVEFDTAHDRFFSTHWRAHIGTPSHRCLRCQRQYNSSLVVMELDGSLDDSSYTKNLSPNERPVNQNVFAFSQGVASMEVNLMLRYLLAPDWWPAVHQQEYQFITGTMTAATAECDPNCSFIARRARGDAEEPPYLVREPERGDDGRLVTEFWHRCLELIGRPFRKS